jgi:acyl-coenzyme A thioesterase PaaI-like protein
MGGRNEPSILPAVSRTSSQTHVIDELGFEHWFSDGMTCGRALVLPGMCVPGTQIIRIGVLAILADLAAGQPESGAITPTTDLSVRVVRPRPMEWVTLAATVLKAGATLLVVETMLTADDEREPFATSLATFMNRRVTREEQADPVVARLDQPFGARIGARVLGRGVVELEPRHDIGNGFHGTVQGGVLATLGEMAAESLWAADEPHLVSELDIRFLNRVKVGPVLATAHLVVAGPHGDVVVVTMLDAGNAMRPVAHVVTTCVPLVAVSG